METKNLEGTRIESDLIGAREIPASALMAYKPSEVSKISLSASSTCQIMHVSSTVWP